MRALIIGAGGFVGSYLIHELVENKGWEVCATKLPSEQIAAGNCQVRDLDILSESAISELLTDIKPEFIFHLAAQSSVAVSWKRPALTVDINIKGCVNILEAIRVCGLKSRVLLIGSAEEYGYAANLDIPVDESIAPDPGNVYAVTKYTQNMLGRLYHKAYGMDIISVRAFNHIGPGQLPQFVVADFCKQAADIEAGRQEPVIRVGNLSAKRDFTDVRDIVRAYAELAEKGRSGETYNVGSGKAVTIQSILDKICELSSAEISVEIDKNRFRPADIPKIEADITKITKDTGWRPEIDIIHSIKDILDYWRTEEGSGNQ